MSSAALQVLASRPLMSLQWSPVSIDSSQEPVQLGGEIGGVVGPSGSGKTTLLDRVCGLLGEESSCWRIQTTHEVLEFSGAPRARNCGNCWPMPHRKLCCLKPACARIYF